jgi:2-hydroxychromene-2-carboxylate isomerase
VLVGVTILKIMGMRPLPETPLKGPYLAIDAERLAKLFDVPFRFHGLKGGNSLAAMRAFLWLKSQDPALATRFAQRIYRRLWVDGREITSVDAIAEEAAAFGVAPDDLRAALTQPEVKRALNEAVDAAVAEGVFGVPFFVADGEKIWGSDRMWMIEHWLQHHSWSPRPDRATNG